MKVEVIEPHGFCAGVRGALAKAEALPPGSYCLHAPVHNELVAGELARRGMQIVESLADVPDGATVLFSAHGVAPRVRAEAAARGLTVVDATCPFVARVHDAARTFAENGMPVVVIGNPTHAEVKGIAGEVEAAGGVWLPLGTAAAVPAVADALTDRGAVRAGVVSQTTMNADDVGAIVAALRTRFPVETTAEVCRATKVRQDAVKAFRGDALLVLGSVTSSNTRRLCDVARCRTFRAATPAEFEALDFTGVAVLGVTSGASTPEFFFADVLARLSARRGDAGQPSLW